MSIEQNKIDDIIGDLNSSGAYREDILYAILNNNVDYIKDAKLKDGQLNMYIYALSNHGLLNPNYEFIDYIINKNVCVNTRVVFCSLVSKGNVDKLKYMIDNTNDIKQLIILTIQLYNQSFGFGEDPLGNKFLTLRALIYIIANNKDKITLDMLCYIKREIYFVGFVRYDVIAYILSRIIDTEKLIHATELALNELLRLLIRVDAPSVLIKTVEEYAPTYNKMNILRDNKPINYISLFEEDT